MLIVSRLETRWHSHRHAMKNTKNKNLVKDHVLKDGKNIWPKIATPILRAIKKT